MSNDVALFDKKYESAVPAIRSDEADALTTGMAGGQITGLKRISIRAAAFRRIIGGKEVEVSESNEMNIVIVGATPAYVRTYYGSPYVEGETPNPDCWSDDGVTPSEHCDSAESTTCADCDQNVKGSARFGEGRACRYASRMAVVLGDDLGGDVYGLQIPGASVFGDEVKDRFMHLQAYAQLLNSKGFRGNTVVTTMKFDKAASAPMLMFRALRPLTEEEYEVIEVQGASKDALQHIGPRKFDSGDGEAVSTDKAKVGGDGDDAEVFGDDAPEVKKAAPKKKRVAKKKAAPKRNTPTKVTKRSEEVEDDPDVADILEEWG